MYKKRGMVERGGKIENQNVQHGILFLLVPTFSIDFLNHEGMWIEDEWYDVIQLTYAEPVS
jgi:hypothetical protein